MHVHTDEPYEGPKSTHVGRAFAGSARYRPNSQLHRILKES